MIPFKNEFSRQDKSFKILFCKFACADDYSSVIIEGVLLKFSDTKLLVLFVVAGPLIGLIAVLAAFAFVIDEPQTIVDLAPLWWGLVLTAYSLGIMQSIISGFIAEYLLKKTDKYWIYQSILTVFSVVISSAISVWDQYDMISDILEIQIQPTWEITLFLGAYPALVASIILGSAVWIWKKQDDNSHI